MEQRFGALILAGGKARRMGGRNKALLFLEERTFLARLETAFSDFEEKLLSTGTPELAEGTGFLPLTDQVPDRGPLEGIRVALSRCRSEGLVVAACDMPLFPGELAHALINALGDREALVCRDRTGGLHPLCGIYRRSCLPTIQAQLDAGDFRVRQILEAVNSGVFSLEDTPFPDEVLTNINTQAEFQALLSQREGSTS